ncbi:hypothetical protein [Rhodovulum sp. FJ3]|uniref:hypothetical protein n=1 Tax=Rhodovulum sp. FJ3 TaxID=3079053 RepID=UPI00293DEA6F|nr:hypothetical protein [Rhodovulum sp. FJ3]MDV4168065.1 hypothetical protein [Rhodovulum sp. FJ3]
MNMWLVRASRWARNPPSMNRVIFGAVVIAICLVLFGIERIWGWPEWLTPNRVPRGRVK